LRNTQRTAREKERERKRKTKERKSKQRDETATEQQMQHDKASTEKNKKTRNTFFFLKSEKPSGRKLSPKLQNSPYWAE
jgi:hypothetical protein